MIPIVDSDETGRAAGDEMVTLFGLLCFATLGLMALTEGFGDLPGAVTAFASAWYILRL